MILHQLFRLCFLGLIFSWVNAASAQDHPPFSKMDVFGLEWATEPQISPDGQHIVYVRRGMDIMKDRRQSRLWLMKADGREHFKLTDRDVNESSPSWSPDGTLIAFVSSTDAGSEIFIHRLATHQTMRITQLERSPAGLCWSPDGKQLAFSMLVPESAPKLVSPPKKPKGADWAEAPKVTKRLKHESDGSGYLEPGYRHLFVVPAEGGTPRQISSGEFNFGSQLSWTHDGQQLIFSANLKEDWEYDFRNSEIYSIEVLTGKTTALTDRPGPDSEPILSPNGRQIAYTGYDDKVQTYQLTRLYVMDLDGSNQRELNTQTERSIANPVWDAAGTGVYFQYDDQGTTYIGHVTLAGKLTRIAADLGGTSIGRPYGGGSFSVAEKAGDLVYTLCSPYHPADVALIKKGDGKVQRLTQLNAELLDFRTLGQIEEVRYTSSIDGLPIQGWVVKPPTFDSTKTYPLLVENHGGPISNYGPRFSPEIQLFAAAGYVVFYPNPRGSTGYGEEFGNKLYHNYPAEDYQDIMDGVDLLLQRPYLAEDSLFVTGGSAGGIMTAWMIGKNNRFRAAAVVKPVMNWISKTLTADNYYGYAESRYPGQPWENMEVYMKFSPVSLVGNIETPTLVMVGTADLRTPLSEAKQLYHALKLRKIETALVEIPGASHFIANRPSQLITKVDHILAWFEQYR